MLRLVVTTSRKHGSGVGEAADAWARRLGVPVAPRGARSIAEVCRQAGVDGALVVSPSNPPTYVSADGSVRYFFHPGMALTRIRNLKQGLGDPMVRAMGLGVGDSVLDCTLGRAADAVIASYVVGPTGEVVGLESSPLLAELTIHGLRTYRPPNEEVEAAMRRIQAQRGDHLDFLRDSASEAFDVVYFDPLFGEPVRASSAMQPFRPLADPRPLDPQAVAEARRVARRRVVIKERPEARLWDLLGVQRFVGGKRSSTTYGII